MLSVCICLSVLRRQYSGVGNLYRTVGWQDLCIDFISADICVYCDISAGFTVLSGD